MQKGDGYGILLLKICQLGLSTQFPHKEYINFEMHTEKDSGMKALCYVCSPVMCWYTRHSIATELGEGNIHHSSFMIASKVNLLFMGAQNQALLPWDVFTYPLLFQTEC